VSLNYFLTGVLFLATGSLSSEAANFNLRGVDRKVSRKANDYSFLEIFLKPGCFA
jgi:hypothetical protein